MILPIIVGIGAVVLFMGLLAWALIDETNKHGGV